MARKCYQIPDLLGASARCRRYPRVYASPDQQMGWARSQLVHWAVSSAEKRDGFQILQSVKKISTAHKAPPSIVPRRYISWCVPPPPMKVAAVQASLLTLQVADFVLQIAVPFFGEKKSVLLY